MNKRLGLLGAYLLSACVSPEVTTEKRDASTPTDSTPMDSAPTGTEGTQPSSIVGDASLDQPTDGGGVTITKPSAETSLFPSSATADAGVGSDTGSQTSIVRVTDGGYTPTSGDELPTSPGDASVATSTADAMVFPSDSTNSTLGSTPSTASSTSQSTTVAPPGCGDGNVAMFEQCDDANNDSQDGCGSGCRIELGFKCSGEPSVCSPTVCGDAVVEGVEGCDDGNNRPFDGCSERCTPEPECEGLECQSPCGDGLVMDEACDDGNLQDGDGCSSSCIVEPGFQCAESSSCEVIDGSCVIRVGAIHRDFAATDPDFGIAELGLECEPDGVGTVASQLDADGLPELLTNGPGSCVEDPASFARWFREGQLKADQFVLYDNGSGGFTNRFGNNGERFQSIQDTGDEYQVPGAHSQETCLTGCEQLVRNNVQCDNECRPAHDAVSSAEYQVAPLEVQLEGTTDEAERAELLSQIAEAEAEVERLQTVANECDATCQADFEAQVGECVVDCKPCSFRLDGAQWCIGGEIVEYDGTPLFFPVDDVLGSGDELVSAKLPPEYGFEAWPFEEDVFPDAGPHNFSFTTEVRAWFRFEPSTQRQLDFMSDDDAFVFINHRLALDLGGVHTPKAGSIVLDADFGSEFGMVEGGLYEIALFKAERQYSGSTLLMTFPDFMPGTSVCSPN